MLSQKLDVLTIWIMSMPGNFLNGRVLHILRQRSFRVRIRRSATGTCSCREHLLRVTPMAASSPRSGSNCPSASRISSKNPRLMYTLRTTVIFSIIVLALAFFSQATVPNLMPRLMVTRNGILLTFMTSTQRMTRRYCAMIVIGIGTRPPARTWSDAVLTVLPFKDPRSGPKMSSAL